MTFLLGILLSIITTRPASYILSALLGVSIHLNEFQLLIFLLPSPVYDSSSFFFFKFHQFNNNFKNPKMETEGTGKRGQVHKKPCSWPRPGSGPPGICCCSSSWKEGAVDVLWEPPVSWMEDPYFLWGMLSIVCPMFCPTGQRRYQWVCNSQPAAQ